MKQPLSLEWFWELRREDFHFKVLRKLLLLKLSCLLSFRLAALYQVAAAVVICYVFILSFFFAYLLLQFFGAIYQHRWPLLLLLLCPHSWFTSSRLAPSEPTLISFFLCKPFSISVLTANWLLSVIQLQYLCVWPLGFGWCGNVEM